MVASTQNAGTDQVVSPLTAVDRAALDQVEQALERLERTDARYSELLIDPDSIAARHAALRREVAAAVSDLDTLIATNRG